MAGTTLAVSEWITAECHMPNPSEQFAKAVLDAVTQGRGHELIAEQSNGEADILVTNAPDGVQYVEVTESTNPLSRAWQNDQASGPLICPELSGDWRVWLETPQRLSDRLRELLCELLRRAEELSLDSLARDSATGNSDIDSMITELPIDSVRSYPYEGSGSVHLDHPVLSSFRDQSGPLASAVQEAIQRKAAKLRRLEGVIELFVVVDIFNYDAFSAFDSGSEFADLKLAGARRVWVSSTKSSGPTGKVLCYDPDEKWTEMEFCFDDLQK